MLLWLILRRRDIVNLARRRVDFKAVRMFPTKVVTEVNVV